MATMAGEAPQWKRNLGAWTSKPKIVALVANLGACVSQHIEREGRTLPRCRA